MGERSTKGGWENWRMERTRYEKRIASFKHSSVCGGLSIGMGSIGEARALAKSYFTPTETSLSCS